MPDTVIKRILRLVGVPFLTFLFFVLECSDPRYYIYFLLGCFVLSVGLWESNRILNNWMNLVLPWGKSSNWRVAIQIPLILILTCFATWLFVEWAHHYIFDRYYTFLVLRQYFFTNVFISFLYSAIFNGEYFYNKWRTSLIEAEKLKRQNLLAQYESLKNQINPHFLFNSINTLAGLIAEDRELAIRYCEQFAKIYRYILDNQNKELVPLRSELDIFEKHAFLLDGRFRDNLKIEIDIPEQHLKKQLPPLTLQMLLENAIKHNVVSKEMPLIVTVATDGHDNVIVKNNIQQKNSLKSSTGVGLENIRKRYQVLTTRPVEVQTENGSFIVKIPLLNNPAYESTDYRRRNHSG